MKNGTFEIGKTYTMHSVCDQDCTWTYEVVSRTACTVKLREILFDGSKSEKITTCRINNAETAYFGYESVLPLGRYSMSPVLSAK